MKAHSTSYQKLVAKMNEVSELEPQNIGVLSPIYHRAVPYVKHAPWIVFAGLSIVGGILIYAFLGAWAPSVASYLQYGF
jgi:hypothetical protein